MDAHFKVYNHIIAIKNSNGDFLPIINEKGMVGSYAYGFNWVFNTWRVNRPNVLDKQLQNGMQKYLAFYCQRNNVSFDKSDFKILVKKIDFPTKWEHDFLNKMTDRPWQEAGELGWENGEFYFHLDKPIEEI